MVHSFHKSRQKRFKTSVTLFNIILLLIQINAIFSGDKDSCLRVYNMSNTDCFNDKIIFDNKYRAGHFETTKEGVLIIEYSNDATDNLRFFYGLNKNGRYHFKNETAFKYFTAKNPNNDNNGRYESKNILLHFKSDTSKTKEYLFSTSIHTSVTELHDLENDISVYWDTISFWDIEAIFSYEIVLLEIEENSEMHYICVFTQHEDHKIWLNGEELDFSQTFSLRKFSFTNMNSYSILKKHDYKSNYNSRMISAYLVTEWKVIVVFFLKADDNEYKNARYTIAFYNYNLEHRNEIVFDWVVSEPNSGNGIFFRCFHLKWRYGAYIYYKDKWGNDLNFEIKELNGWDKSYTLTHKIGKYFSNHNYAPDIKFNDFYKVDENRLVFVTTKHPYQKLYFFVIDLYNTFSNFKMRKYSYSISQELHKEMQGYSYNGYIIFTYCSNPSDIFSTLLFFGYANGTDFEIDISPYLMDANPYDSRYNLYDRLFETFTIDNNIFGYEKIPKINLVEIPNELLFYNGSGTTRERNKLPNNTFFDANHTLYQNMAINKTHKLYHLDYQFLVKEPDYDTFYSQPYAHEVINDDTGSNYFKDKFTRKTFYGRTNRLYFSNCVMIIVDHVLNLEELYINKNV